MAFRVRMLNPRSTEPEFPFGNTDVTICGIRQISGEGLCCRARGLVVSSGGSWLPARVGGWRGADT